MSGRQGHGESISLACIPRDAKKLNEELRARGVTSAEFNVQIGIATWTDKNGRNALLKMRNAADFSGGYGDHTPG